jgi:hypothetical protein
MPSGRLRFAVLAATVAAFLLVPVAQASAAGKLKVNVVGTGSGEVLSEFGFGNKGTPPIACSYASPGPATGVCENEMAVFSGKELVNLLSVAGGGSDVGSVVINKGKDNEPFGPEYGCNDAAGQAEVETELGGWFCEVEGVGGIPSAEVTVAFCLEGQSLAECTATPPTKFLLKVEKTGEGTVVSSPAGINCGGTCSAEFTEGSMVTLTASPGTGYALSTWAGCTTHNGLTCTVEMSKAKTVKVAFVATPSLTIEKTGSGQGKVGATGISCDENCSKDTSAIKTGTAVTVKVTPGKGSEAAVFENGTGSASACSGGTCSFPISENSSVKVKFNAIPTKSLTVKLTGPGKYKGKVSGKGTVKGLTLAAISCGTGCTSATESFFSTDAVTLTAVAATGYTFAGWSGSGCSGTGTCSVATSSDKTVEAEFK